MPEDKSKPYVTGTPICEECGKYRPLIIPVLERHETGYGYELVKRNLCVYHFMLLMEEYELKYPEEEPPDNFKPDNEDGDSEEEPDDSDPDGCDGCPQVVKCNSQDCVWHEEGTDLCGKDFIQLTKLSEKEGVPLFMCSEYIPVDTKYRKP
jgi:hypothetical protein